MHFTRLLQLVTTQILILYIDKHWVTRKYADVAVFLVVIEISVINRLVWSIYPYTQGLLAPGGRLNKKDGLTRYGDSHVKDKTS